MFSDTIAKVLVGAVLGGGVLLSSASCSIREYRMDCPCFLVLDFTSVETARLKSQGMDSLIVCISDGQGFQVREGWGLDEEVKEYSVAVPKTGVDVGVVCSDGGSAFPDPGFLIPEGEACPSVYMYSERIETGADGMSRAVSLHKNWCNLELSMSSVSYGRLHPFRVELDGNVCGYCLDGTPMEGHFTCLSDRSMSGMCSVSIPRQTDDSLWLRVLFTDSDEIRSFPIGEYIAESGYDWSAEDLEDVSVQMDFFSSGVSFTISSWKKTLYFEITI